MADVRPDSETIEFAKDHDIPIENDYQSLERLAVADAVTEWVHAYRAGLAFSNGWYDGHGPAPEEPLYWKITHSGGGPASYMQGDFGLHGAIDVESIRFHGHDWNEAYEVTVSDEHEEAAAWYADLVAC